MQTMTWTGAEERQQVQEGGWSEEEGGWREEVGRKNKDDDDDDDVDGDDDASLTHRLHSPSTQGRED